MKLPFLIAAILAAAPLPASAQPASDALVETLLSVLPDRDRINVVRDPDPAEIEFLGGLNPGREAQIRTILGDFETCVAPALAEGTRRMIRTAARSLGDAKLAKLIEFYRSDPAVMVPLLDRLDGPSPSAADKAEEARLLATYPLAEYMQAFEQAKAAASEDSQFAAEALRCEEARDAAIGKAGLKVD
jgi:hypothetical protein